MTDSNYMIFHYFSGISNLFIVSECEMFAIVSQWTQAYLEDLKVRIAEIDYDSTSNYKVGRKAGSILVITAVFNARSVFAEEYNKGIFREK